MMSKAMWVIENVEKTEGKPIELNKPFRLLSLAKQQYLCCLYDTNTGQINLSLEKYPTENSTFIFDNVYSSDRKYALKNDFLILVNLNWRMNVRLSFENKKTGVQLTRVKNGANVLKISKCHDGELLISHLDISASSFLTTFLEKLEEYSS